MKIHRSRSHLHTDLKIIKAMGNSVNKIESSLTSTIEDSLYEIILSNLICELKRLLDAKISNDSEVRRKQKMLVKILLDAKNECVRDAKNQIVSSISIK